MSRGNRRRPLIQRLVRRVPLRAVMTQAPLIVMSALCATGCLIALLSGFLAVAFVLGTAAAAGLTLQLRQQDDLPT